MIKTLLIMILVIALLYRADVQAVVTVLDTAVMYWNTFTVTISTFKDRHPLIMAFLPFMVIILLRTMKDR